MKITIPEIEEYGDVLETLNDLPKSVRIKVIAQAIREYKDSAEGGAVISLLKKRKKEAVRQHKNAKDSTASPPLDDFKKVMGGFLE
ncbi:MAG TPA: hypothetical protein DHW81_02975 [Nitrospiraceae bacterium]|nr:MAG: hypothetical protein A2X55_08830 [Nitrospirae bacterium GWB2_47_37]HAK87615.1 hypothetical protein [Nitrospiraceae bacterium]HCL81212.1 hypothetical protein [Nitrospiraceae bacterium]